MINMMKKFAFKKVLSVFLLLLYATAIIIISRIDKVSADIKVFQLVNAKIAEKSENAKVDVKFNEKSVNTNFTFHKINDYIVYNLTFKNNDKKDYIIKGIYDDNENPYVIYSYEQFKDQKIKAGGTITIPVKITYDSEVNDLDKRNISDTVKFSFNIMDKEGNMVIANSPTNSRLAQNIIGWAILVIVILAVVIILIVRNKSKNKTVQNAMLLLLLIIPITTHAINPSFEFTVKANIKLHDKLAMTVVNNGVEEKIAVPYGEAPSVLEKPKMKGYDFVGWYADDEEFDFDTEVSEDIEVTAKYKINSYAIKYDYGDGTVATANPTKYNVESKSFTLNNPVKEGYTFSGWTGSNGKVNQTRVTIDTGTVGDLTFKANFSPKTDIPYVVIHKYRNYDGNGFSEVFVEHLVGATDSIVQPAPRTVEGFVNPPLKTLRVTLDGRASIEYIYERAMYTLSYNSDVISDKPVGTYKYGTTVNISAVDKVGYSFNKWGINVVSVPAFIDMDDSNSITVGDIVAIGSEWFYVVAPVTNGEVKLLAKYNIDKPSGRQKIDASVTTFSGISYWDNGNPNNYGPIYVYSNETDRYGYYLNYLITTITKYQNYLNSISNITIKSARAIDYNEANNMINDYHFCPISNGSSGFWTGSALNRIHVYTVIGNCVMSYGNATSNLYGVRPIITINESDISVLNATSSVSSFVIKGNTNVVASYKPYKNTSYSVVHKKQDVNDESLFTIADRDDRTGITSEMIRPSVKNNYGSDYTVPTAQTVNIAADGSTIVEYLYYYKYYNITLDPNGGFINTESVKVAKGESVSLTNPMQMNATFLGWYTEPDGGTLVVEPGESFTPTKSQTLYAHWEMGAITLLTLEDTNNDNRVSYGDKVTIGYDEFYFVGTDNNGNYKLLTVLPINQNYRQDTKNLGDSSFSSQAYWKPSGYTSGNFPNYTFNDDDEYKYVYRTSNNQDVSENGLKYRVNNYVSYLQNTYNMNLIDYRLMNYTEATNIGCTTTSCPSFIEGYSFYLGTTCEGADTCPSSSGIWMVSKYYHGLHGMNSYSTAVWQSNHILDSIYVRPIIIVPKADIETPWGDNVIDLTNFDAQIGDEITIVDEVFYYIGRDANNNIKLFPKYNLDANYRQSANNSVNIIYSSTNYWADVASSDVPTPEGCQDAYCDNFGGLPYTYRTSNNEDVPENNLTSYVNNYASYLRTSFNLNVVDARLMSYHEVSLLGCADKDSTCPRYMCSQSYWLGNMMTGGAAMYAMELDCGPNGCSNDSWGVVFYSYCPVGEGCSEEYGVRPVVILSASES